MLRKQILVLAVLLAMPGVAAADTMTFSPPSSDMHDLDHAQVYFWGINVPLAPGESVIAAELSIDNICNWDNQPNDLYIHLLDWASLGLHQLFDNAGGGDYFETTYLGVDEHLITYEDLTTSPQDLTYTFSSDDLVALNAYLADGRIGIGIDPDCHYYNDGIELTIITPEPATMAVFALGLPMLFRRRMR